MAAGAGWARGPEESSALLPKDSTLGSRTGTTDTERESPDSPRVSFS